MSRKIALLLMLTFILVSAQVENIGSNAADANSKLYAHTATEWFQMGMLSLKKGEYKKAEEQFSASIKRNPKLAPAHNYLGDTYEKQGKLTAASSAYKKALAIAPSYTEPHLGMAHVKMKFGDMYSALCFIEEAMAIDSTSSRCYEMMGNYYSVNGAFEAAIDSYKQAIRKAPKIGRNYYLAGKAFYELRQIGTAYNYYKQAVNLRYTVPIVWEKVGGIEFFVGEFDSALKTYENGLKLHPKNAELYYLKGDVLLEQHNYKLAIRNFTKSIDLDETNHNSFFKRAVAYLKIGKIRKAKTDIEKAVNMSGNSVDEYLSISKEIDRNIKIDNATDAQLTGHIEQPAEGLVKDIKLHAEINASILPKGYEVAEPELLSAISKPSGQSRLKLQ